MLVFPKAPVLVSALALFASAAFTQCSSSSCTTGVHSHGIAQYMVCMPEPTCWNHNMVVFAHGYVDPNQPLGIPASQLSIGGISLPATFNKLGYGFAASSYSKNGLAIEQGVEDTRDLVQNVIQASFPSNRVYLIGASEGGLITCDSDSKLARCGR